MAVQHPVGKQCGFLTLHRTGNSERLRSEVLGKGVKVVAMRSKFALLRVGLLAWGTLLAGGAAEAGPINLNLDFTGADYFSPLITGVHGAGDPGTSPSWANDPGINNDYGGPTRLRLTSNGGGQRGNAWYNGATVEANAAWNAEFDFQITYEGGGGADGLAFHLQEIGTTADTFIQGQGLGANFLSVVIDTWDNGGECAFGLDIYNNGAQVGSCFDLSGIGPVANNIYTAVMTYDGLGGLAVNVINQGIVPGGTSGETGVLNYTVDLSALNTATLGWSGQTGGAAENHDILGMTGTFVPEPGTGVLLGAGLVGLSWRRRRRA